MENMDEKLVGKSWVKVSQNDPKFPNIPEKSMFKVYLKGDKYSPLSYKTDRN
jgi:hypothetical protein